MPTQQINLEQLVQDYVRERDAMVQKSVDRYPLKPDRLLAAVRQTRKPGDPAANRLAAGAESHWVPNTDIFVNREQCLIINVELAGISRANLEISVTGNRLTIGGCRPQNDRSECRLLVKEIDYGAFECVIDVPAGFDLSQYKAAYQNGFLHVEVPKAEAASLPLAIGPQIEDVLHAYVQDRDRIVENVVLKQEETRPAIAPSVANALKESSTQSWFKAPWRFFLALIGRAPSKSRSHPSSSGTALPEAAAAAIFNKALARLAQEYADESKSRLYESLKHFIGREGEAEYAAIADKLRMTTASVHIAVHLLRRRFASLIREEIAQMISSPDAVEDEVRRLFLENKMSS